MIDVSHSNFQVTPVGVTYDCAQPGQSAITVMVNFTCKGTAMDLTFGYIKTHGSALIVGTGQGWSDVVDHGTPLPRWVTPDIQHPMFSAYNHSIRMWMQVADGGPPMTMPEPVAASAFPRGISDPVLVPLPDRNPLTSDPIAFDLQFRCKAPGDVTLTVTFNMFPFKSSQLNFTLHCMGLKALSVHALSDSNSDVAEGGVVKLPWAGNATVRGDAVHFDSFKFTNADPHKDYLLPAPICLFNPVYEGTPAVGVSISGDNLCSGQPVTLRAGQSMTMNLTYDCSVGNGLTQMIVHIVPPYAFDVKIGWLKSCGTRPGFDVTRLSLDGSHVLEPIVVDGATQSKWVVPASGHTAPTTLEADVGLLNLVVEQRGPFPAFRLQGALTPTALTPTTPPQTHKLVPEVSGPLALSHAPYVPQDTNVSMPLIFWPLTDLTEVVVTLNMSPEYFLDCDFAFNVKVKFQKFVRVEYSGTDIVEGALTNTMWAADPATLTQLAVPLNPSFTLAYKGDFSRTPGKATLGAPVIMLNDTELCQVTPSGAGATGGDVDMNTQLSLVLGFDCLRRGGVAVVHITVPVLNTDNKGPYSPMQWQFMYSTAAGLPGMPTHPGADAGDATATFHFVAPHSLYPITHWRVKQTEAAANSSTEVTLPDFKADAATQEGDAVTIKLTNLTNGVPYQWRVAGVSDGYSGAFSKKSAAVTPGVDLTPYILGGVLGTLVLGAAGFFAVRRMRQARAAAARPAAGYKEISEGGSVSSKRSKKSGGSKKKRKKRKNKRSSSVERGSVASSGTTPSLMHTSAELSATPPNHAPALLELSSDDDVGSAAAAGGYVPPASYGTGASGADTVPDPAALSTSPSTRLPLSTEPSVGTRLRQLV